MDCLVQYDFGIKYIKGNENKVTNALSRHRYIMAMTKSYFDLLDQAKESQNNDPYCLKINDKLEKSNPSVKEFEYKDGFLCFKGKILF